MVTAKFVHPECGYPSDSEDAKKADLVVGNEYPVYDISVGGWYTNVYLDDHPGAFNSVLFEFFEDGIPLDIFRDPRFNHYMRV